MANNTTLPGTGDVIADEDVSGVKYQLVKLVDGTAAGTGRIGGDATNGLDVDVTRVTGTVTVAGTVTANAGTGTLAVSIATAPVLVAGSAIIGTVGIDQTTPGTTNLVALTANQSVNVAQVNGVATTMNNGVVGTGVQRVTIASDSTGQIKLATGAATIGALTANQSVNNAQINGVTPLMGNGVSGTGAQRVTMASDSTGILAGVTTVTTLTGGGVAEDAVITGNPLRIGGRASNVRPTAMSADGDFVSPWMSRSGGQVRQAVHVASTALSFAAGLQSLAASATVGQVSTEVDLTAESSTDVVVQMKFTHGASVATGAQAYEIYVISSMDGTTYDGDTSYSGTAAAYTLGAAASINLTQLGVIRSHAASGVYAHSWSLKNALGFPPRWFAIVVINNAGTALAAAGNSGAYTLVF